jgi:hypothetical protein
MVEFLMDVNMGTFYFIKANPRIQVEPATPYSWEASSSLSNSRRWKRSFTRKRAGL